MLFTTRREMLTIWLSYSEAAVERELHLIVVRGAAPIGAAVCGVAALVLPFPAAFVLLAVGSLVAATVAQLRLGWVQVAVRLDASH